MQNILKKALTIGVGLAAFSKDQVEKVVDELVKRGEVPLEESKELIQELMDRGEKEQAELKNLIKSQLQQGLAELDVANQSQIAQLEARIKALEEQVQTLEQR